MFFALQLQKNNDSNNDLTVESSSEGASDEEIDLLNHGKILI